MAKGRKRKRGYGKRRAKSHRKNPRRVRAAKRAYKKSGLYKYNLKKKRGKRGGKKRYGKKRKARGKKRSKSYGKKRRAGGLSTKGHQVYQTLINRGRTPQQAYKVAARLDRMRTGKVKRYFQREAQHAKSAQQLHNLFAGIGAAGHLAAVQGGR